MNQTNNGFDSNKPTPHKWAHVIKAWADGNPIQYSVDGEKWTDWIHRERLSILDSSRWHWRVKPNYPTLGEIASRAWYVAPSSRYQWDAVAAAVKAAIESGEHA
jgi:hypothetical protein